MKRTAIIRIIICTVAFFFAVVSSYAQNGRDYQKEFDEFLGKSRKEFDAFQKKNEEQFVKFLEYAWAWFEGKPAEKAPKLVVPQEVPPLPDDIDIPDDEYEVIIDSVIDFKPVEITPIPGIKPMPVKPSQKGTSIVLFGNNYPLRVASVKVSSPDISSDRALANAWKAVDSKEARIILEDCQSLRSQLALGDWAYLKLVHEATVATCPTEGNARVLMEAWLLLHSGLCVRMATDERLHYLVNFD